MGTDSSAERIILFYFNISATTSRETPHKTPICKDLRAVRILIRDSFLDFCAPIDVTVHIYRQKNDPSKTPFEASIVFWPRGCEQFDKWMTGRMSRLRPSHATDIGQGRQHTPHQGADHAAQGDDQQRPQKLR